MSSQDQYIYIYQFMAMRVCGCVACGVCVCVRSVNLRAGFVSIYFVAPAGLPSWASKQARAEGSWCAHGDAHCLAPRTECQSQIFRGANDETGTLAGDRAVRREGGCYRVASAHVIFLCVHCACVENSVWQRQRTRHAVRIFTFCAGVGFTKRRSAREERGG